MGSEFVAFAARATVMRMPLETIYQLSPALAKLAAWYVIWRRAAWLAVLFSIFAICSAAIASGSNHRYLVSGATLTGFCLLGWIRLHIIFAFAMDCSVSASTVDCAQRLDAMASTISRGEAWLLETLSLHWVPMWCLSRDDDAMHQWLLRGSHGLPADELHRVLLRMCREGDVEATRKESSKGFMPTESQICSALNRIDTGMGCRVTALGGNRWESLAQPEWELYFDVNCWEGMENGSFVLSAATKGRLSEVLALADLLWRVEVQDRFPAIKRMEPWWPFWWKLLPEGFEASVSYVELPFVSFEVLSAELTRGKERHKHFRHWATSICGVGGL